MWHKRKNQNEAKTAIRGLRQMAEPELSKKAENNLLIQSCWLLG